MVLGNRSPPRQYLSTGRCRRAGGLFRSIDVCLAVAVDRSYRIRHADVHTVQMPTSVVDTVIDVHAAVLQHCDVNSLSATEGSIAADTWPKGRQ